MGKLTDELVDRLSRRFGDPWLDWKSAVRSVVGEMFEERRLPYFCDGRCEWAACLVPRPQPQPTLAEAARALAEHTVTPGARGMSCELSRLAYEVFEALKREEV